MNLPTHKANILNVYYKEIGSAISIDSEGNYYEESGVIIFGHAVLMLFGLFILLLLGWIIDIVHLSDTAKHIAHIMDEYLMIFAFVVYSVLASLLK